MLGGDGEQDAGFGGAVELGHGEAGEPDGAVEFRHLREGVLPDAGVEHEQHFMWRTVAQARRNALDLGEFLHQGGLGLQAPGRVRQHYVDPSGLGPR